MASKRTATVVDVNNTTASKKKAKKPTTIVDKILDLLSKEDKLIGLATIKKILKERYDVEDNAGNNKRISKALKDLSSDTERLDFGKIGGSYHGGIGSTAYVTHLAEQDNDGRDSSDGDNDDHTGMLECPMCEIHADRPKWCHPVKPLHKQKYYCDDCDHHFYPWTKDIKDFHDYWDDED